MRFLPSQANQGRIDTVQAEGGGLIAASHFAAVEIQARMDSLDLLWRELQVRCTPCLIIFLFFKYFPLMIFFPLPYF